MREILFRGKCIRPDEDTGKIEWVYGNYMTVYGVPNIEHDNKQSDIDRNTLGQYTGVKDKNGTRIFEGDILEGDLEDSLDPGARWRSIVVWGTFGWMCKDRQCLPMDTFDVLEGEVIGNIHDNPELLER